MSVLSEPLTPRDHRRGNPDAPVVLVEYGDYQCPYCGQAHPVVEAVREELADDLLFVFRNFPLSEIHPHALHAASAAEYADSQGKFWEMHDLMFENQPALIDRHLVEYGVSLGLDEGQLRSALDDEQIQAIVAHDFSTGVRSGVNGTPTFFINGVRHDGSWDHDSLVAALRSV